MTLTLASSILVSICIAKGLAMNKLGGVITPRHHTFNDYFTCLFGVDLHIKFGIEKGK